MKAAYSSLPKGRGGNRGQAIVEFALVIPILIILMIGIIEMGWLSKNYMTVVNAAREGARAAAVGRSTTNIQLRVQNAASPMSVTVVMQASTNNGTSWFTLSNSTNGLNNASNGALIRVQVNCQHSQLTDFFPGLNNFQIRETAVMRREPTI